ncbi:predicted protein [Naegleria gruberi]|uniref:Predicted protein n=1 Tax=Naegleria gruberi TaxID=5762 RepID=D2VFW9_NAEGR|nr:uncharacterized protein NAEGRDRAFT_67772 [Naegleria gruberi]EFC44262.1 predicted protein [Naegleria gruberi]|eukprot:XP_002677006.1 predicted protein [Naegleria gruberi strain NEG-M]
MKRGHHEVDNILPEMEQDNKKSKLTIPVSTVRKMNHTEVVEMMRNVGLDENTIKCLDQTFTGALVFLTVLFLKDIMKREEEHGWWKEALDEILPSCNNNMKAAEEIICLLVGLYVPREQDLGWVEAKLSKVDRNGTNWVNELYDEAFEYVKSFDSQRPLEPIEEFIEKNFKSDNVKYCSLNLVSHETFARPLPIKFGTLAKHYLPFIPSLQIESNNDKILERTSCKTVTTIIAPSGTGKTSLMIRRLCKTAGLLLTGTATYEHDSHETTDSTIRTLISCLNSRVNAFGYIRHAVQILLISKLTYLLLLIEKSQKEPSILDPFEGSLLSFLAFNQFNGSNDYSCSIFVYLFPQYKHEFFPRLQLLTKNLISKVKEKTNSSDFVICVDEANVLEDNYKYISSNGNEKGALCKFIDEIMSVNSLGSNIIAGTSFSIKMNDVTQSHLQKTEYQQDTITLSDFEYLDYESFNKFLSMHIKVKENFKQEENFPIRIRQAAQCMEYFIGDVMKEQCVKRDLQQCFDASTDSIIQALKKKAVTHQYSERYGTSFYVPNKEIAAHFLMSGIAGPVGSTLQNGSVEFKTVDVIGFKLAKEILRMKSLPSIEEMDLAIYVGQQIVDRTTFEIAYLIALSAVKGKFTTLFNFNSTINESLQQKLKTIDFACNKVFTCNGFKDYCLKQQWITASEDKTGEELYLEYAVHNCERINKILFRPPASTAHDDGILALTDKDGELVFIRFSLKCLTGKDYGYKSTLPELMFKDNYQKISLPELNEYVDENHMKKIDNFQKLLDPLHWWGKYRADFLKLSLNRTLSVILHPDLNL